MCVLKCFAGDFCHKRGPYIISPENSFQSERFVLRLFGSCSLATWVGASSIHPSLFMTLDPAALEITVNYESQMFLKGPISACCFRKCYLPVFADSTSTYSMQPSSPRARSGHPARPEPLFPAEWPPKRGRFRHSSAQGSWGRGGGWGDPLFMAVAMA